MISIPFNFSLSGYAYDPEQPTYYTERLSFILSQVVDAWKTQGLCVIAPEASDKAEAELYVKSLYESVQEQDNEDPPVDWSSYPSTANLLVGATHMAVSKERSSILAASILRSLLGELSESEKAALLQETILYLSDGTPIYGSTGLIA